MECFLYVCSFTSHVIKLSLFNLNIFLPYNYLNQQLLPTEFRVQTKLNSLFIKVCV